MLNTVNFMITAFLIIVAYDIFIIYKKGKYYSISAYIIRGSRKSPLTVLLFGIILGHLFWSMSSFDYLPKEVLIEKCKAVINE